MSQKQNSPIYIKDSGYYISPSGRKQKKCLYKCFCGNEFEAIKQHIKTGNTKSCGCLWIKYNNARKHSNLKYHPLYQFYRNMIARCYNPKHPSYKKYSKRGIEVCGYWLESFENFKKDMEATYSSGLSLDRIKNNLGYFKQNCRWVTPEIQYSNKDSIKKYKYNGKIYNAIQLSTFLGGGKNLICSRLKRGLTLKEAIETPIMNKGKRNIKSLNK